MSKIFDTHCHPQMQQYDADRETVLERARKVDVGIICVGVDIESSRQAIELATNHENVWATAGLHPNDISKHYDIMIYHSALTHPKVVAVGEVGLDYYRTPEPEKQELQREVFKQFIELAIEHDKPLIIHCRSAHADMISILENYKLKIENLSGVIHSFTGTWIEAQKYLELGFYIGLNGIITFLPAGRQVHGQYDETVINMPLERILLETDAPYLTPEPYRGKRNEPAFVVQVAQKIGDLRGIKTEEVIEQTTKNAKKLFRI